MEKTLSVRKCCIPDCTSTSERFALFRFPQDRRSEAWASNICQAYGFSRMEMLRNGINPIGFSYVCELHFLTTCFSEHWSKKKQVRLHSTQKPVPTVLKRTEVMLNIFAGKVGLPGKDYSSIGGPSILHTGTVEREVAIPVNTFFKQSLHSYAKPLPIYAVSTGYAPYLDSGNQACDHEATPDDVNSVQADHADTTCTTVQGHDSTWVASEEEITEESFIEPESFERVEHFTDFDSASSSVGDFMLVETKKLKEVLPSVCNHCTSPLQFSFDTSRGTGAVVKYRCVSKKSGFCTDSTWMTQSKLNHVWKGDIRLSSAILCTGDSPAKALRIFDFIRCPVFSYTTFFNHQYKYIVPGVVRTWRNHQNGMIDALRSTGQPIDISGDGSCDSMGNSATYCRYVTYSNQLNRVLDVQLVKKSEVGGHSPNMERLGLEKALSFLSSTGLVIRSLITDRHRSIQAWMRRTHPNTRHYYDIWHVAKSVSKKLKAASQKSGCKDIELWIPATVNHMYWVAQNGKTSEERVAMWMSIANHVVDIHHHHSTDYPECRHGPMSRRDLQFLVEGSRAHVAFEEIVSNKTLLQDIRKLSKDHQTFMVEIFNSLLTRMAPKNLFYGWLGHAARTMVAALHFNHNAERQQRVTADTGKPMWRIRYQKHRKNRPVIEPVRESADYGYFDTLRGNIEEQVLTDKGGKTGRQLKMIEPPSTIRPRADKEALLTSHQSRFSNSQSASSFVYDYAEPQKPSDKPKTGGKRGAPLSSTPRTNKARRPKKRPAAQAEDLWCEDPMPGPSFQRVTSPVPQQEGFRYYVHDSSDEDA